MDYERARFCMLRLWVESCGHNDNDPIDVIDGIEEEFQCIPLIWENILEYIISVFKLTDGPDFYVYIMEDFGYDLAGDIKIKDVGSIVTNVLTSLVKSHKESENRRLFQYYPFFVERPDLVPVMVVSLAAAAKQHLYQFSDMFTINEDNLKEFFRYFGAWFSKPVNTVLDSEVYDNMDETTRYGKELLRLYFATKTIQKAWRQYRNRRPPPKNVDNYHVISTTCFKLPYALLKLFIDYALPDKFPKFDESQAKVIESTYTYLPLMWTNILDFVRSSQVFVNYDGGFRENGYELGKTIVEVIKEYVDENRTYYETMDEPYFIYFPHLLPLMLVTKECSDGMFWMEAEGETDKLDRYKAICGLSNFVQITCTTHIYFNEALDYGLKLIRAYFAAKTIQQRWRQYYINKCARKIQKTWRHQIASPFTKIGRDRLHREFNEMIQI